MLCLSLMVGLLLMVTPAHITVLGTQVSCGTPIVGLTSSSDDPSEQAFAHMCQQNSFFRLVAGGVIVLTGGGGGLSMLIVAGRRSRRESERQQQLVRWQAFQRSQVEAQAREWAEYEARRAEWDRLYGPQQ